MTPVLPSGRGQQCSFADSVPTWLLHRLISGSGPLSLHFERQPTRMMVPSLTDLQSPCPFEARETSLSSVTPRGSHRERGRVSLLWCPTEVRLLPSLLPLCLCWQRASPPPSRISDRKGVLVQFSALFPLPMSFMSPPPPGTAGVGRDRARHVAILSCCFLLPLQW